MRPVSSALARVGSTSLQLVAQAIEFAVYVSFRFGEAFRGAGAEMFFNDSLDDGFESFEEICELQAIFFQHAAGVAFDHRQTRTRNNRRRGTIEQTIDFRGLREVSNFGGAAVVRDRRQKMILDHRAQSHVWTEAFRRFERHRSEFGGGVLGAGSLSCGTSRFRHA